MRNEAHAQVLVVVNVVPPAHEGVSQDPVVQVHACDAKEADRVVIWVLDQVVLRRHFEPVVAIENLEGGQLVHKVFAIENAVLVVAWDLVDQGLHDSIGLSCWGDDAA